MKKVGRGEGCFTNQVLWVVRRKWEGERGVSLIRYYRL